MRVLLSVAMAGALVAISGQQAAWAQRPSSSSSTSFGSRSGSSAGQPPTLGSSSIGQAPQGNERFVRGSRQAGDFVGGGAPDSGSGGFVGSQASGANASGSRSSRRQTSTANRGANQSNRSSSRNSRDDVRAHIRLGFTVVRPAEINVVLRLQHHLGKISLPRAGLPIQIEVEKGTAILRGAVASAHDRAIAERLALLEGGIWKVQNELTVAGVQTPPAPK